MRHRYASWAVASLLALGGCASEGRALGEGEGSTMAAAPTCAQIDTAALSATTLRVTGAGGEEETVYCGRDGTYLLASPRLSNNCFPDGFACPRFEPLGSSPAMP